jgi:hypothetical protein
VVREARIAIAAARGDAGDADDEPTATAGEE